MLPVCGLCQQTNLIGATGKVGIGTATPTKTLEIVGETRMHGYLEIQNDATITKDFSVQGDVSFGKLAGTADQMLVVGTDGRLTTRFLPLPSTVYWELGGNSEANNLRLGSINHNELELITNNSTRLRIDGNGLTTIGNGPLYKKVLEVDGMAAVGNLQIGPTPLPAGYRLSVNGKMICEEVDVLNIGVWPDYVFSPTYPLKPLNELEQYVAQERHLPGVPSAEEAAEGIGLAAMNRALLEKVEELTLYILELNKRMEALENKQ